MHFLTHSCTFSSDIVALLKNIFFNDILALLIVTFCTYSGDILAVRKLNETSLSQFKKKSLIQPKISYNDFLHKSEIFVFT